MVGALCSVQHLNPALHPPALLCPAAGDLPALSIVVEGAPYQLSFHSPAVGACGCALTLLHNGLPTTDIVDFNILYLRLFARITVVLCGLQRQL